MARAYLSLGSNLEPRRHLRAAVAELRRRFGSVALSPVYRTPAVGFDGPDFLNAAAMIETELEPEALNDWLHALEARHGRVRGGARYASRTLDVDIVLHGDCVMTGRGNLELPRGELAERAFVLQPMADLAPAVVHPTLGRTLAALWRDYAGPRDGVLDLPLD